MYIANWGCRSNLNICAVNFILSWLDRVAHFNPNLPYTNR